MASIEMKHIVKKYGDGFPAINDVSIDIAEGEFIILVGPSGSGKSTLLRMIVGLEDITSGDMMIDGKRVNELAPRDRNLAMVFQNYALYPHLTVFENIAFPLRLAKNKMGEEELKKLVNGAAKTLELTEHLDRKPGNLSGGQRQRVAMGRAIVRQADAFLFDEPLSNLDAKLRGQMRTEIAQMQRRLGITSVYVTHDQTEAMTLGDRVAVLKRGVLQQVASPRELYEQPINLFVAGFIGSPSMNFLPATVEGNIAKTPLGDWEIPEEKASAAAGKGLLLLGVRPEAFEDVKFVDEAVLSRGSRFSADLTHIEWLGNEQYGYIQFTPDAELTGVLTELAKDLDAEEMNTQVVVSLDSASRLKGGRTGEFFVDTRRIHLFDPSTGENLTRDAEEGARLTAEAAEDRAEEIAQANSAIRLPRQADPTQVEVAGLRDIPGALLHFASEASSALAPRSKVCAMAIHERATCIGLANGAPNVPESAVVLPGAVLCGDVRLGERVGVYPNASLRAETEAITLGEESNIQDSVSCHTDTGYPLTVGDRVSVGHNAVLHGCTVEDDVLIGMHATVMNGAVVGAGSLIAAGALVTQGTKIPPRSLVAGVPAKVLRPVTDDEYAGIIRNSAVYVQLSASYAAAFTSGAATD